MKLARLALVMVLTCGTSFPAMTQVESAPQPKVNYVGADADQAKTFFEKSMKTYATARTYSDTIRVSFKIKTEPDMGMFGDQSMTMQTAFARPNKLAYSMTMDAMGEASTSRLVTDGKKVWIESGMMSQYVERDAPEAFDFELLREQAAEGWVQVFHPSLTVMTGPHTPHQHDGHEHEPMLDTMTAVRTIESIKAGKHNDRDGTWLDVQLDARMFETEGQTLPATLWFNADGVMGYMRVNMASLLEDNFGLMEGMDIKVVQASVEFDFQNVAVNGTLPDNAFSFTPTEGMEKVDKFEFAMPDFDDFDFEPRENSLVDKPAPDFSGTLLTGGPISLESLRGKVVLVDFWATWCPPCVQALPALESLWKSYAGKDVVFIGMNLDDRRMEDQQVIKFLADKGVTFRQVRDLEGEISNAYGVTGIPCTVIIDRRGVVRNVHVGFVPGMEDDIRKEIDSILADKN
ncbi:MAG: TlpA family protein disulfide reductase [Phycisphaeraceae bacterium]|nr:TlpA family protein disulfide reductase [Phycisphaeraceae bacterium]